MAGATTSAAVSPSAQTSMRQLQEGQADGGGSPDDEDQLLLVGAKTGRTVGTASRAHSGNWTFGFGTARQNQPSRGPGPGDRGSDKGNPKGKGSGGKPGGGFAWGNQGGFVAQGNQGEPPPSPAL